jgi:hypothetical protein
MALKKSPAFRSEEAGKASVSETSIQLTSVRNEFRECGRYSAVRWVVDRSGQETSQMSPAAYGSVVSNSVTQRRRRRVNYQSVHMAHSW